jgi:nucleotide-binding universal stress UspA family protein
MSTNTTTPNTADSQKAMISKILVAVDGSDASMHAADYAVLMSNKYDAELYALHVVHPADVDAISEPTQASSYSVENTNQESQKYLDKVKLKANENNIQLKTEVVSSVNAAGGIVDYAEAQNVDLVVVGARGKSGFRKLLLGSVASNVVTYAHCPVLVIK